jgi:hypothetical protein
MRTLTTRLGLLLTALVMVFAVTQGASTTALVASIAAVAIAGVLAVKAAAFVAGRRVLTVGARANAHREALTEEPAPAHPATAGRTRSRAPSQSILAA